MQIFLDTADIKDIEYYKDFIDGVTTNPSILSKHEAKSHKTLIKSICEIVQGPVSVEVVSENFDEMLKEAHEFTKISELVCVKLPCTYNGLRACKALADKGIMTNMTLCFSPTQAVLAAKCGATFVSPFIGRLDDVGEDGLTLIEEIQTIYQNSGFDTAILAASVRSVHHVKQAAIIGADAVTVSPKILQGCMNHHLTDAGLQIFAKDWKNRKQ